MRKWLVFALLIGLMVSPSLAGAQGGTKLDSMNVELWSEYDQPTMLVINQFIVSQDTGLPATVTLRFPKNANLVAVAVESDGELLNKDFTGPVEQGEWQTITISAESHDPHRVEYYQPLTRDEDKRQFKYQWFGDYYVKEFTVAILVPAGSTDLVTSPVLQKTEVLADGSAISGIVTKNELKMGNSFQFNLEYERSSDVLIDPEAEQIRPVESVGEETTGRVSIANLPWIIGGFGLALILIALYTYWHSTQSGEAKPQRRRRRAVKAEDNDEQAYCHECGARAYPGDRFCRTCGSRLKVA